MPPGDNAQVTVALRLTGRRARLPLLTSANSDITILVQQQAASSEGAAPLGQTSPACHHKSPNVRKSHPVQNSFARRTMHPFARTSTQLVHRFSV